MSESDATGQNWTDTEIDLIIADYFDMLRMELSGKPFVKAHRNAALQKLISRSHKSIEFKHQNISAVLLKLGLPWIVGYKPKAHFQNALLNGVGRFLAASQDKYLFHNGRAEANAVERHQAMAEPPALYVDPPPPITQKDVEIPEPLKRLIRKFDPAARDARNRALGREGEERVFAHERSRLAQAGRDDLARKVRWVSEEDGDGAGFDVLSFWNDGRERCLEVKTTVGHLTTPFYLSENERAFSAERPDAFRLMRLYDFARTPRAFELAPPLESCLILEPTNYRASFEQ